MIECAQFLSVFDLTHFGIKETKDKQDFLVLRRSTVFQPKQKSCIILFGIPNFIVEVFKNDSLPECMFMLDPSYGQSPSVDIFFNETFPVMYSTGK